MKKKKRPWYKRLFKKSRSRNRYTKPKKASWFSSLSRRKRRARSRSKISWFKKALKSDVQPIPLSMRDPEKLAANVANRNLNIEEEIPDQSKTSTSIQQDIPSQATVKLPEKEERSRKRRKKSRISFKDIKVNLGGFNLRISIYSLGLFILSYLFINFIYQFSVIFAASLFNIDAVLYYYEVYFPIGNNSNHWNSSNVIGVTIAGPLVSALVSIIFFRILSFRKSLSPWLSIFLYWAALHAAVHFLGAFVGGVITREGFGYVANWLHMNVFFKILISLIFLSLLSLIGYYAQNVPRINYISRLPQSDKRFSDSLSIDIVPWLLGTLLLLLFKRPDKLPQHQLIGVYDTIILASMSFAIVAKIFNAQRVEISRKYRFAPIKNTDSVGILAIALFMLVFLRYVLAMGIHFLINIRFSAGLYE